MSTRGHQCKVVLEHQTKYPDPICAEAGVLLQVGDADPENPGWRWCTAPDGKCGWVPEQYLEYRFGRGGVLTRDYAATELNVRVGEEVVVKDELAGWLWVRSRDGSCGWIPRGCVCDDIALSG